MATIRNSLIDNVFGDGKEKIVTLDNGDKYVIKNTCVKNVFGDGYEQKIEKINTSSYSSNEPTTLFSILAIILLVLACPLFIIIALCTCKFTPFMQLSGISFGVGIVCMLIHSIISKFK